MFRAIAVIILLFIISCKKESTPSEPMTEVKVTEAGSGTPIAKANVVLFQTTLGGLGIQEFFKGQTNNNGISLVPTKYFDDATITMDVQADKYWGYVIPPLRSSNVTLQPEGWIRVYGFQAPIHLYPEAKFISMYPIAGSNGRNHGYENPFPVDTYSVLVRAFGGDVNMLAWQVTDENNQVVRWGQENDIEVPRFDTTVIMHLAGY